MGEVIRIPVRHPNRTWHSQLPEFGMPISSIVELRDYRTDKPMDLREYENELPAPEIQDTPEPPDLVA